MTVMCDRFFGLPQSLIRNGLLKKLSPIAFCVIVGLWHESERYRTRRFRRTTKELIELVGGCRGSHAKARAELIRAGLVVIISMGAEGFEFHLCNPETGQPWPLPPKEPVLYQRKNPPRSTASPKTAVTCERTDTHHPSPAQNDSQAYRGGGICTPESNEADKPVTLKVEDPSTSFPYGRNVPEETYLAPQRQDQNRGLSRKDIWPIDQEDWAKN